jgi:hypothetical protein
MIPTTATTVIISTLSIIGIFFETTYYSTSSESLHYVSAPYQGQVRRPLELLPYQPHPQMYHKSPIPTNKKARLLINETLAFITQD